MDYERISENIVEEAEEKITNKYIGYYNDVVWCTAHETW